jgi:hypothetical protein
MRLMTKPVIILLAINIVLIASALFLIVRESKPNQGGEMATTTATSSDTTNGESESIQISAKIEQGASALGVEVEPLEILEDSRCPANVNCIQAGTVRVRALLTSGLGTATQVFELSKPITTESEEITLVEVEPQTVAGVKILPNQYIFKFEIKKRKINF